MAKLVQMRLLVSRHRPDITGAKDDTTVPLTFLGPGSRSKAPRSA